jgi:hypothetical protein
MRLSSPPETVMNDNEYLCPAAQGLWRLKVWAQPGAKHSGIAGLYDGRVRIRLSAPAVDNKANKELIRFVAQLCGVKQNRVRLESGVSSRKKVLLIERDTMPVLDVPETGHQEQPNIAEGDEFHGNARP